MRFISVPACLVALGSIACAYETVEDAAIIARKLVDDSPTSIGTMATVFPEDHPSLADQPFALQEYYASCHHNGSLTLLFLPIARHSQNILHSSNHSASISIWSPNPSADRARVSLMGSVTVFRGSHTTPNEESIKACYLQKHPDAKRWLPDDEGAAHTSYWARFDPQSVYFVGGFGDKHYIGSIPVAMYQDALSSSRFQIQTQAGIVAAVAGRVLVQQT